MKRVRSVSVLLLQPLVQALASSPAALQQFFGATDLTPQLLADPDARVSPAQFCVAWAETVRLTGDPQLALRIADSTPPGAFGLVEYLCRAAPTVGEALRQWVRFLNLLDDAVVVGLVVEGGVGYLRVVSESEAPAPASHELCFALVCATIRRSVQPSVNGQPFRPLSVEFTHRAPAELRPYELAFDAPVRFGAANTQLVLASTALQTPMSSSDPGLLAILARHAEELKSRERAPPLTTEVRRALQQALQNDQTTIEAVARRLGVTPRTLQRRLEDEGTTFQALRESTRRDLAAHYLDQDLSIAEISFLLGFSEPSAFFRAFKRWTGITPQEARGSRRLAHS